MAATSLESQKNREAESAYVRKNLWGAGKAKAGEDDMGHTILGDVTYPAPVVINQPAPQQNNSVLPLMIGMLASGLMGGGAAGVATYLLTRKPAPVQQEFQDETLQIGLGRIEDFTMSSNEASDK